MSSAELLVGSVICTLPACIRYCGCALAGRFDVDRSVAW